MKASKIIMAVLAIVKDSLTKACVCFTVSILIFNIVGAALFLNVQMSWLTPSLFFMFALASFLAGIAAQVFKITKIPAFSRHISFFILIYAIFFIVAVPLSNHSAREDTTLVLSVAFIAIYLVIFGIYMGIKSAVKAVHNSKLKYEQVYKNVK